MASEFQVQNIALKTLKQRCEYLQERLIDVEEENCKLKLEKTHLNNITSKTFSSGNALEEQIIILEKEKAQLSHQIDMVTAENFNLWSQLSKALPGSDISAENLTFSPLMNSHQGFKFNQSASTTSSSDTMIGDFSKESLEEISLKLINGILMGKNELENQYSQMIDLQREPNADDVNLILPKHCDNRTVTKNMREYIQKLKDFKHVLYQQKSDLSNAIMHLKNFENASSNVVCNRKIQSNKNNNKTAGYSNEIQHNQSCSEFSGAQDGKHVNWEESNEQMVCPICGETFGVFDDCYRHAIEHIEDDNDEFVDASADFQ